MASPEMVVFMVVSLIGLAFSTGCAIGYILGAKLG